jgi:Rha family phage regulatory protein
MKNEIAILKTPEQRINEIMTRIKVFERDGELWTDSLSVAEVFGKRHDNILDVIRRIDKENQLVGLPAFREAEYIDAQGKPRPFFEMTETGFFALGARFNDQKAAHIAEKSYDRK